MDFKAYQDANGLPVVEWTEITAEPYKILRVHFYILLLSLAVMVSGFLYSSFFRVNAFDFSYFERINYFVFGGQFLALLFTVILPSLPSYIPLVDKLFQNVHFSNRKSKLSIFIEPESQRPFLKLEYETCCRLFIFSKNTTEIFSEIENISSFGSLAWNDAYAPIQDQQKNIINSHVVTLNKKTQTIGEETPVIARFHFCNKESVAQFIKNISVLFISGGDDIQRASQSVVS